MRDQYFLGPDPRVARDHARARTDAVAGRPTDAATASAEIHPLPHPLAADAATLSHPSVANGHDRVRVVVVGVEEAQRQGRCGGHQQAPYLGVPLSLVQHEALHGEMHFDVLLPEHVLLVGGSHHRGRLQDGLVFGGDAVSGLPAVDTIPYRTSTAARASTTKG